MSNMNDADDQGRRVGAIAALDQPQRRELFRLLRRTAEWISRDDAAHALGVPRSVAAFHLDKLADAGVVEVRFDRTSGRTGPGAGRPSKLFRLTDEEFTASIPDRRYDIAGSLLAAAIAESTRTGVAAGTCLGDAATREGELIGRGAVETDVMDVLAVHGYEPRRDPGDEIVLANCPFHRLAEQERELVCHMNRDFLAGVLAGLGSRAAARLDPQPGQCCVRIVAEPSDQ